MFIAMFSLLKEKEGRKDNSRRVMTKSVSDLIRSCAEILRNHVMIAKINTRNQDIIALGAQYHCEYLLTLTIVL